MFEEALGIRNGDRMESFTDKIHKCLLATSARFSQIALEFAEGLLDRVEVR
jgi:urate oxidase